MTSKGHVGANDPTKIKVNPVKGKDRNISHMENYVMEAHFIKKSDQHFLTGPDS